MIGVALKGLAGRKVRALLTAFAVVIGVSMVSGTFILTDTMQKSFDGLFDDVVRRRPTPSSAARRSSRAPSAAAARPSPPVAARPRSRRCPRSRPPAATVAPQEANTADIIGDDGKAVARESIGASATTPPTRSFTPLKLKTGEWAQGAEQVVIDAGTAAKEHYEVGDAVEGRHRAARRARYELTGIATFGDVDSLGCASIAAFDLQTAQTLLDREGRYDSVSIAAKDGTSPAELVEAVAAARARQPGGQATRRRRPRTTPRRSTRAWASIRNFLLGFGGIALFVGAFVIFNTLSITVAQRTREFATLRTLGASRKQVLRSVVLEGLVIGLLASRDRARARPRHRQGHDRAVRRARASTCPTPARSSRRARSSCRCCWARSSRCSRASCPPGGRRACRRSRRSARARRCPPTRMAAHSHKPALGVVAAVARRDLARHLRRRR